MLLKENIYMRGFKIQFLECSLKYLNNQTWFVNLLEQYKRLTRTDIISQNYDQTIVHTVHSYNTSNNSVARRLFAQVTDPRNFSEI